jgi:hypothetical protein
MEKEKKQRAGHYEVLGETYAKFEFFENGWNPYSRFLDEDKVDLILRSRNSEKAIYREIQVKYGKLYQVGQKWELPLFDITSWRFFNEKEFDSYLDLPNFYLAYVLAEDIGYKGDIFIFHIKKFAELIRQGIYCNGKRKIYFSRLKDNRERWVLRTKNKFTIIDETTTIDISSYRRNFELLK